MCIDISILFFVCFFIHLKTLLGDDQYIFTRLNKIFDSMPSTPTLSHKLFPRPPTPFSGNFKLIVMICSFMDYMCFAFRHSQCDIICLIFVFQSLLNVTCIYVLPFNLKHTSMFPYQMERCLTIVSLSCDMKGAVKSDFLTYKVIGIVVI